MHLSSPRPRCVPLQQVLDSTSQTHSNPNPLPICGHFLLLHPGPSEPGPHPAARGPLSEPADLSAQGPPAAARPSQGEKPLTTMPLPLHPLLLCTSCHRGLFQGCVHLLVGPSCLGRGCVSQSRGRPPGKLYLVYLNKNKIWGKFFLCLDSRIFSTPPSSHPAIFPYSGK